MLALNTEGFSKSLNREHFHTQVNYAIPHALFSFISRKSVLNILNQEVPDLELPSTTKIDPKEGQGSVGAELVLKSCQADVNHPERISENSPGNI